MNAVLALTPPQYPALYTAARAALFRCDQIDECREWSNKAAAMESYARQARDMDLLHMAERIHARAVRRCGELLVQTPSLKGVKTPEKTALTRTALARSAGLDAHHQAIAIRVAAVPAEEFEREVEKPRPATVTALSERGRKVRGGAGDPSQAQVTEIKKIRRFAKFCAEPSRLDASQRHELREAIAAIAAWCAL